MVPLKGPKSLFKYGEERSIACDYTHEQKINFDGFNQNGNQPHPFGVLFYSVDSNSSC